MIYLVTKQLSLFESKEYEVISVEKSLELLNTLSIIGLDTETSTLTPSLGKLLSLQLGCYDFQVVIDTSTIDVRLYKGLLEDPSKLFLLWNAKFDTRWLYHFGILLKNVYDGYLAEKLMWLGYPPGIHGLGLKDAAQHYLGESLDKSVRGQIIYRGLCDETIVYGSRDVKFLELIKDAQRPGLIEQDLLTAVDIENKFVLVLAYIEHCGVKVDEAKWKKKMEKDSEILESALSQLNKWVEDWVYEWPEPQPVIPTNFSNLPTFQQDRLIASFQKEQEEWKLNNGKSVAPSKSKFVRINLQGDLWSGFDTAPRCSINWNSSRDVIELLELLGYNLNTLDKKTGLPTKSVEATTLSRQEGVSTILEPYLAFKSAQKTVSTYGQNVLDAINPVTGRIHTNITQLLDTTRISTGGGIDKDLTALKHKQVKLINIQNFPGEPETRSCFVSEPGNKWISFDYQGEESIVLANLSNDEAMLDVLSKGKDFHSLVAKMCFPKELEGIDLDDVKEKAKHIRKKAKGPEFTFAYGGDSNTLIARGFDPAEAKEVERNYKSGFKGVAAYQDRQRKLVMDLGYIIINDLTKHRAHIYDFDKLKEVKEYLSNPKFMSYYKNLKEVDPMHSDVQEVKRYFKRKSASERQGINYKIQGTGAQIFRFASIYLFNWICKNGLFGIVKYTVPAHDEINLECPEDMVDTVADVLERCMVEAGKVFCKQVPLAVDKSIGDFWIH